MKSIKIQRIDYYLEWRFHFYSNSIFQATDTNPTPAGDMLEGLDCPMLGMFGAEDANPSGDDVALLRNKLGSLSKTFELVTYNYKVRTLSLQCVRTIVCQN